MRESGGRKYVIKNIFDEEETVNLLALIPREKTDDITTVHHIIYSGVLGENFGGYKLFGTDLSYYASFCSDENNIYSMNYRGHEELFHFQGFETRTDTDPYKLYKVRKKIEMLIECGYFNDEFELYVNLVYYLMPFLQKMYRESRTVAEASSFDWKIKKTEIKSMLIEKGVLSSKWKNEESLFKLVKKNYPDALYQYRPDWLKPQSLDIFIPSLNVGIEYQGIQHYESVDFFGGDEGFALLQRRDKKKKNRCAENNVKLIAWAYYTDITASNLSREIQKVMLENKN